MSEHPLTMVVVDVDGTLLRRDGTVSPRVLEAIHAVHDRGVVVTLATGRGYHATRAIAEQIGVRVPIVLHNGAVVKDSATGEILDHTHLPLALARRAIEIVVGHGCQPIVYENAMTRETILSGPPDCDSEHAARYLKRHADRVRRRPYHAFDLDADPIQLLVLDLPDRAAPLERDLVDDDWRTVTSVTTVNQGGRAIEVLQRDCSKLAAVKHLALRLGLGLQNVLGIGDNYNDLDLIEGAGVGVAMGNAPPEVQAAADWVTASNQEDGVALALERFVLGAGAPALSDRPVRGGGAGL